MYNGVPIVGIPFFYDQWNNVAKMEAKNLGKEVLDNSTYTQNIKKLSKAFRSQKETPLERAVFWVEYVLEHKDLSYLNNRGRSMTWYERENLDIFGFFLLLLIAVPILAVTWYERENLDIFGFFLLLLIAVPILAVKLVKLLVKRVLFKNRNKIKQN
ncbi:UDP-glucoronosyl and UDP-glucosyl transferase [Popillia japonica]|uniref:UDP-glucoronosyl and UDP-glucosyl transferase n=1 Tax=Popillia japonica TaxID=7064 RepID=A0AAW1MDN2_POPJA